MDVIPGPLEFEWDKGNRDKSLKKHRVTNEETEQVFNNNPLVSKDLQHSTGKEERYQCLGETDKKKKLFISFTLREAKVRIISARPMSRRERKVYEKEKS